MKLGFVHQSPGSLVRGPGLQRGDDPGQLRLKRLNQLLDELWESNLFYARKWRRTGVVVAPLRSLGELKSFPFTTRAELLADQSAAPPLGSNVTAPPDAFKRFHRSSGTTRAPLLWGDTDESWRWVMHCSQRLWQSAGVTPADRVLFLMPFGASSGPWIMHEGACRLGCASLAAGAIETGEQLRLLVNFRPTVVAGKPGSLHSLARAAYQRGAALQKLGVSKLILTGECSAQLRAELEQLWETECFDRYGLTEAGSVAGECTAHCGGLHLLEDEFLAESIDPGTGHPVGEGEPGELVLTNLGRIARPIIRYRTGDMVRLARRRQCRCGRAGPILLGGITRCPGTQLGAPGA